MRHITRHITRRAARTALIAALLTAPVSATAHSDRGEKRPKSYAEAFIPMTDQDFERRSLYKQSLFRHPPGNIRAEDMRALFNNKVLVISFGRESSTVGAPNHSLKVIFMGSDGRYSRCGYRVEKGDMSYTYYEDHWAPVKVKHAGTLQHMMNVAVQEDFDPKRPGISPLYDGATGEIVFYRKRKTWHTWNPGHLQERLPRAVWTLCPDFPSAEELGVEVNEAQTAITYDRLIAQDPGRRVLRPDLITPDPTEVIK